MSVEFLGLVLLRILAGEEEFYFDCRELLRYIPFSAASAT